MPRKHCFVTYCSKNKRPDRKALPAIERYQSERIGRVQSLAQDEDADFYILSGRFGLLSPDEPIPWYDQLMKSTDVEPMARMITKRLRKYDAITFLFREGDYIEPYRKCIELAAEGRLTLRAVEAF